VKASAGPLRFARAGQCDDVARERAKGESVRQLARILGVSKSMIGRIPAVEP
jgi:hypothetical protein